MNLWTRFLELLTGLLVDTPENMVLASTPTLDYRSVMPWWLGVLFLLIMAVGVVFLYALETGTVGWIRRVFLIFIRTALLALILFLLFRPVLLAEFKGERSRHIVVMLDTSQSMKLHDRRVTVDDSLRVAIARNLVALDTKLDNIDSISGVLQINKEPLTKTAIPEDPARTEMVRWVLTHPDLKLMDKLGKKGPLQPWVFGNRLKGLGADADANKKAVADQLLDGMRGDDAKTSLYDSINSILQRKDGDQPAAMVIITDGQDNNSKLRREDVAILCKQAQVPLYVYGVGSAQSASLQLKDVHVPDTLFVKDKVGIPISWKSRGIAKGKIEISVEIAEKLPGTEKWGAFRRVKIEGSEKDGVVQTGEKAGVKRFQVAEGTDLRDLLTIAVPEKPGLKKNETMDEPQKVRVTIELVDNDLYKGNKKFKEEMVRDVRVTNRKIKVLIIENSPRFEFKFLQTALDPERERRFETTYMLVKADPEVAKKLPYIPHLPRKEEILVLNKEKGEWKPRIRLPSDPSPREEFFFETDEGGDPNRKKQSRYDVIVLGDVAPEVLSEQQLEWIKEFVEKKQGGLIVMAGRQHMPAGYKKTKLAEVLPVEFEEKRFGLEDTNRPQEYPPTLSADGQRTDMLFLADNAEENLKTWQSLPGFYWQYPVTKLRPGAISLVYNPRARMSEQDNQPMPVVATQIYGNGQVLFCGSDETWRWRKDVESKHFVRYWGQILYQMGLPHLLGEGSKRVQFAQQRAETTLDKSGYLYVRAFDKDFNPREGDRIAAILEDDVAGERKPRELVFKQAPGADGKPVKGEYKILLPNDKPGKFEIKLTNLGEKYSFKYRVDTPPHHELDEVGLAEKNLRALAKDSGGKFYREEDLYRLADDVKQRKVNFQIRQEVVLWNPLAMLLFIVLISSEWLIRKFSNLS